MTKRQTLVFFLFFLLFGMVFIALTFDLFNAWQPRELYNITVIVRGKNSDSWESIRQGAEQAADTLLVELNFITLSEENNVDEQIRLLDREFLSGADAIILSAADSNSLASPVEAIAGKIPVLCIESPVNTPHIKSYIAADDYAMGAELGKEIIASGNGHKRLAIVESSLGCDNVKRRLAGLRDVLETNGAAGYWQLPSDLDDAAREFFSRVEQGQVDVVVALDARMLELTAQAISDAGQEGSLALFGFGASSRVATFIEKDIVQATVVKNDFGIGYLAVQAAADAITRQSVPPEILVEHRIISSGNMYEIENQRLLFPFVR